MSRSQSSRIYVAVVMILALTPVWMVGRVPIAELPQHLLMIELARAAPSNPGSFEPAWKLLPGSLFYWFSKMFFWDPPVSWVGKIALSLYVCGTVLSLWWLSHALHGHLGTPVAYGLLTVYGWFFYQGNISLLMGLPLVLSGIALLLTTLERAGSRFLILSLTGVAAVGLLLYLSDLSLFALFLGACLLIAAIHRDQAWRIIMGAVTVAGAALFVFGILNAVRHGEYFEGNLDFDFLTSDGFGLPLRLRWPTLEQNLRFTYEFVAIWKNMFGFGLYAVPLAFYVPFFIRKGGGIFDPEKKIISFRSEKTMFVGILAASSIAFFWLFPATLPIAGYWGLNQVFMLTGLWLLMMLRSEPESHRYERYVAWYVLPAVLLLAVLWVHIRTDRALGRSAGLYANLPPNQSILFLDFKKNDTVIFQNPYKFQFCDYHIEKGGDSPYTFAWYVPSPVKYRQWMLRYPSILRPADYKTSTHHFGYDYVVAIGNDKEIPAEVARELITGTFQTERLATGLVAKTR